MKRVTDAPDPSYSIPVPRENSIKYHTLLTFVESLLCRKLSNLETQIIGELVYAQEARKLEAYQMKAMIINEETVTGIID